MEGQRQLGNLFFPDFQLSIENPYLTFFMKGPQTVDVYMLITITFIISIYAIYKWLGKCGP